MLYVAVVTNEHFNSERPDDTLSCFIGIDKDVVTKRAILAAQRWQAKEYDNPDNLKSASAPYGPYKVLLGELNEEAKFITYTVEPLQTYDVRAIMVKTTSELKASEKKLRNVISNTIPDTIPDTPIELK